MDWPFRTRSHSKPPSRLLDLPQEIRDLIFEFALTSSKPLVAFHLDQYQRQSYQEATHPPLTRVSRQVRKESLPIFYDCNDLVLHTEETRQRDIGRCLACLEPHLSLLNRVSIWIRFVNLTNDRTPATGAFSISMRRRKVDGVWIVGDGWEWVTVTRKPSIAHRDAEFLIAQLRRMLESDSYYVESAGGYLGLLSDLRMEYVKEKMS